MPSPPQAKKSRAPHHRAGQVKVQGATRHSRCRPRMEPVVWGRREGGGRQGSGGIACSAAPAPPGPPPAPGRRPTPCQAPAPSAPTAHHNVVEAPGLPEQPVAQLGQDPDALGEGHARRARLACLQLHAGAGQAALGVQARQGRLERRIAEQVVPLAAVADLLARHRALDGFQAARNSARG